jgi:hypothetical protein
LALNTSRHWLALSAVLLSISTQLPGSSTASEPEASIAKLLDVGWGISPQARAAADIQWEQVAKVAGRDPRATEAMWLVLMAQRRFDEALRRLDAHLNASPEDLLAWRAKAWIQTVLKNYSAAMVSAERLSALDATHPPVLDADKPAHDETVAFLGRLMGFLSGPVADAVSQDERKTLERKLLERLSDTERTRFEDARNGVLAKYIEVSDDSAEARERAAAAAAADKAKTLAELHTDKEELTNRARELEERRKKINSELQSELDSFDKQDQPLIQQAANLNNRANFLNNDLLNFQSQALSLQQLAASEKDPARRQQLLNQANNLVLLASRVEVDLITVNRLLQALQTQRASIRARRVQAQNNAASQVDRADRELAELGKRERRAEGLEKRASRPISTTTSKSLSLAAQATALSTYDPFPLETAKARLLESLR